MFHLISFAHVPGIDRVFRGDNATREVYEEGAKEAALSVVSGINCKYDAQVLFVTLFANKRRNFTYFCYFQQVSLLMGKQAVEKHTR